jgi:hypothetical protein
MGPLETTIRRNLSDYLDGETTFADFSAWMYRTILNIDHRDDSDAAELGYSIMLALAEYDSGVLTLPEFQRELRELAAAERITPVSRGSTAAAS